jgi:hypothetical protein
MEQVILLMKAMKIRMKGCKMKMRMMILGNYRKKKKRRIIIRK